MSTLLFSFLADALLIWRVVGFLRFIEALLGDSVLVVAASYWALWPWILMIFYRKLLFHVVSGPLNVLGICVSGLFQLGI